MLGTLANSQRKLLGLLIIDWRLNKMKKIYLLLLIACLVHSCLPQKKTRENLEKEGDLTKEEIIVSDSCLSMPAFTYKLNDYMFVDTDRKSVV